MTRSRRPDRGAADGRYRQSPFAPAAEEPLLARVIPLTKRLSGYRADAGRRDLVAGLTVAALAVPSGMAYAELAGLSPVNGLYALLLPSVAYALLASSRQVIVGPEGVLAALLAAAILPQAAAGSPDAAALGALLGLFIGALFLLARVARLGWIADYLSRPVLVGYIHGVAVVLVIGQLGKLLGLDVEAIDPIPQLVEVAREIGDASLATLATSIVALATLFGLRYSAPRRPGGAGGGSRRNRGLRPRRPGLARRRCGRRRARGPAQHLVSFYVFQ